MKNILMVLVLLTSGLGDAEASEFQVLVKKNVRAEVVIPGESEFFVHSENGVLELRVQFVEILDRDSALQGPLPILAQDPEKKFFSLPCADESQCSDFAYTLNEQIYPTKDGSNGHIYLALDYQLMQKVDVQSVVLAERIEFNWPWLINPLKYVGLQRVYLK